jgi:hypothetical protein
MLQPANLHGQNMLKQIQISLLRAPKPRDKRNEIPLQDAIEFLQSLNINQTNTLGTTSDEAPTQTPPADPEHHVIALLKTWLASGAVEAFVIISDNRHPIDTRIWSGEFDGFDWRRSLETGRLHYNPKQFPQDASDMASDRPWIFCSAKQFNELITLRPASRADVFKTGKRIIDAHYAAAPSIRMRREDFSIELRGSLPHAPKQYIRASWRKDAPPEWKRPGPKLVPRRQ